MSQTLYEYGGEGTPIHIALANGFPPQTYQPLIKPLTDQYRGVCLLPRALWKYPPEPKTAPTWETMADDLLAGFDKHGLTGIIGMGHSMGAVATLLAAIKEPERFKAIVLLDPTIFPLRFTVMMKALRMLGIQTRIPFVRRALDRRSQFADANEAFHYWREKKLFKDWADQMLWLYVQGLTKASPQGGLELAWSPEWEAHYYSTMYTNSWRMLPKLEGLLPILTIRATESTTFFEDAAARMREIVPSMTYAEVEGHGHLFPQSAPNETREIIVDWLKTLDSI